MKFKLDIENKILIPFMILTILPITILGIVSYWTGYQLLISDRVKTQEVLLAGAVLYIETVNEEVESGLMPLAEGKAKALEYFRKAEPGNLAVLEGDRYVLNNPKYFPDDLIGKLRQGTGQSLEYNKLKYIFRDFEQWNWTVVLWIDMSFFLEELISIQKYTLLLTIIFLVLSMQAIIFIAHHISKPIKYFAEVCKKIEIGNLKERSSRRRSFARSFQTDTPSLQRAEEADSEKTRRPTCPR